MLTKSKITCILKKIRIIFIKRNNVIIIIKTYYNYKINLKLYIIKYNIFKISLLLKK